MNTATIISTLTRALVPIQQQRFITKQICIYHLDLGALARDCIRIVHFDSHSDRRTVLYQDINGDPQINLAGPWTSALLDDFNATYGLPPRIALYESYLAQPVPWNPLTAPIGKRNA